MLIFERFIVYVTALVGLLFDGVCSEPVMYADFWNMTYSAYDKGVEEEFCSQIASTCPFLRSSYARPSPSQTMPVAVSVAFEPHVFIGIDDDDQIFSVQAAFIFTWQLPACGQWGQPSATDSNQLVPINEQVWECPFHPSAIWRPSVIHQNSVGYRDVFKRETRDVTISFRGYAYWEVISRFDSSCVLTFKKFPFDRQACSLALSELAVVEQTLFEFDSVHYNNTCDDPLFVGLFSNSIWRCITTNYQIVGKSQVLFNFEVARKGESFITTLFIPTTILTVLQQSTLALPPDTTDRCSFSVTIFLALALFQNVFATTVPQTPEVLFVNVYLEVQMTIGVAITVYSLIIIRIIGPDPQLKRKLNKFCSSQMRLVDLVDIIVFLLCLIANLITNLVFYLNITS